MKTPVFLGCNRKNGAFLLSWLIVFHLQVLRSVYVGAAGGASAGVEVAFIRKESIYIIESDLFRGMFD